MELKANESVELDTDAKNLNVVDWETTLMRWAESTTQDVWEDGNPSSMEQLWEAGFHRLMRTDFNHVLWYVLDNEVYVKLLEDLKLYIQKVYSREEYEENLLTEYAAYEVRVKTSIEASENELAKLKEQVTLLEARLEREKGFITPKVFRNIIMDDAGRTS